MLPDFNAQNFAQNYSAPYAEVAALQQQPPGLDAALDKAAQFAPLRPHVAGLKEQHSAAFTPVEHHKHSLSATAQFTPVQTAKARPAHPSIGMHQFPKPPGFA